MAQKVFEGDAVDREKNDQSKSRTQHLLRKLVGPSQGPPCISLYLRVPSSADFDFKIYGSLAKHA